MCSEVLGDTLRSNDLKRLQKFTEYAQTSLFHKEIKKKSNFRNFVLQALNEDDFSAIIKSFKGKEAKIMDVMNNGDYSRLAYSLTFELILKRPSLLRLFPKLITQYKKSNFMF